MCLSNDVFYYFVFFFKQKTAYEMRISDWSSDVCSSDLPEFPPVVFACRTRSSDGQAPVGIFGYSGLRQVSQQILSHLVRDDEHTCEAQAQARQLAGRGTEKLVRCRPPGAPGCCHG